MPRIAVLMACHNRRATTLSCLRALYENKLPREVAFEVFLVDDKSLDGTSDAVRSSFPNVRVISGNGSLYWNGGMRLAFAAAMSEGYDYYLWLNDDTFLYPDAVSRLLAIALEPSQIPSIAVGTTVNPRDGQPSYGGRVREGRFRPLEFRLVIPGTAPIRCDSMNGNCVLIPERIAVAVGNLDEKFVHAMGDLDYGLRAGAQGFFVQLIPGIVGTCQNHEVPATRSGSKANIRDRLRHLTGPKNLPLESWRVFTRRHGGPFWFAYWLWPYLKSILPTAFRRT